MRPLRQMTLGLMKLGFRPDEILRMGEHEAQGYLEAWLVLRGDKPETPTKRYVSKRRKQ